MIERIKEYVEFLDNRPFEYFTEEAGGAYSKNEKNIIRRLFEDLKNKLEEVKNSSSFILEDNNHLRHILLNSPLLGQALANRELQNKGNIEIPNPNKKNIHRFPSQERLESNFPGTSGFMRLRRKLLSYIEIITGESELSKKVFEKEAETKDGWLENFKDFYKDKKLPDVSLIKKYYGEALSSEALIQLSHLEFFARLEGWKPEKLSRVRDFNLLSCPITADNFHDEFKKLMGNRLLDEDKVYRSCFEKRPGYKKAA